jgi:hypothetical protein
LEEERRIGAALGYPTCCTHYYLTRSEQGHPRALTGTGFVPCDVCNARVLAGEGIIDHAARVARGLPPFPELTGPALTAFIERLRDEE